MSPPTSLSCFPLQLAYSLNSMVQTSRLTLEPLRARHVDVLFPGLADERIYRWIDVQQPPKAEQERVRWSSLEARRSPDGLFAWLNWAVRRHVDGAYIGRFDVELDQILFAINVGFVFLPAYWGQGYASEALVELLGFLELQGVQGFRATAATQNTASARVLAKAGFIATGMSEDEEDTVVFVRPIRTETRSDHRGDSPR